MIERLLSFAGAPGSGWGSVAVRGERAACVLGSGDATLALADATASRGEGALRLEGEETVILGLASQTSQIGFEMTEDVAVGVQAIGVSLERSDGGFEGRGVAFSPIGLTPGAAMRAAWATLEDGSLFVLCALRPDAAAAHASDRVGAARIAGDGSVRSWAEPLLSTEYDGAGQQARATLELWPEEGIAERGAGIRRAGGTARLGSIALAAASFSWRLGGAPGPGGYDVVAPAPQR